MLTGWNVFWLQIVPISEIIPSAESENYPGALNLDTKPLLDKWFCEEVELGRLSVQLQKCARIHGIDALPKKCSATPKTNYELQ